MPKFGKFALVALMTSAMAIPAYAESGSAGASASTSIGVGGAGVSASGNVGGSATTPSTAGASGTNTTASGSTNITGQNPAIAGSAGVNPSNPSYGGNAGTSAGTSTGPSADARGDSMTQYSREGFIGSDTDRSSSLSLSEYRSYLGNTGSRAQIQSQFNTLDTNKDGFLSETELQASGNATTGTQVR